MMVASKGVPYARTRGLFAVVACCLAVLPNAALGASTTTSRVDRALGISIPASARVHGTTTSTTPAPTTTSTTAAPASTTPTAATPVGTTPASGAQPGTVAPSATPTTAAPTTTTPTVGAPTTTVHSTTVGVVRKPSHSTHLSTGALALAVLGALLALGCIVWGVGRRMALEPRWTVSLMHSLREASYRGSATWAEFTDWARLGR